MTIEDLAAADAAEKLRRREKAIAAVEDAIVVARQRKARTDSLQRQLNWLQGELAHLRGEQP